MNHRMTAIIVTAAVAIAAGIIYLAWLGSPGQPSRDSASVPVAAMTAAPPPQSPPSVSAAVFSPPPLSSLPKDDKFGAMVRLGYEIFEHPAQYASDYVGNNLRCSNCHMDAGRQAGAAPLWAAYVSYPAYRSKNGHVNTFAERLQGCFRYSMNGKAPPLGSKTLVALQSYAYWMSRGAPLDPKIAGRGYPKVPKPPEKASFVRGAKVYQAKCALCHGDHGQGQLANDGSAAFPALWGPDSFNWGAGMHSLKNAVPFIKANMPLGEGNTLTMQEAWDVALFMDSHERPQDPRFTGSVAQTRKLYHDSALSMYGTPVNGHLLGSGSVPNGGRLRRAQTGDGK